MWGRKKEGEKGMTAKIPLQNGEFAIVDKEDYERCMEHTWTYNQKPKNIETKVKKKTILLAHFLLGKPKENHVFINANLNKLDYRKENIVQVSTSNKNFISGPRSDNKTGYKGVSWSKKRKKYVAQIRFKGCNRNLGFFDDKDEAAITYNKAARELFGEYCFLNTIGVDNRIKRSKYEKHTHRRANVGLSGYRGVTESKYKRYESAIYVDYNRKHLGTFDTPEQAAKAYDKKAYELHGDKAILNFPELIDEYRKENNNV